MSHVDELSPLMDIDRKPFPFPVSETAVGVYGGFGDGVISSSAAMVEIGPATTTPIQSPFAAASPPPWKRLPQTVRSWYLDPTGVDQADCKSRVPPVSLALPVPASISPHLAAPSSYGHRTPDAGGLFLSHSSNGLSRHPLHSDPSLPASCYFNNAGKPPHQPYTL